MSGTFGARGFEFQRWTLGVLISTRDLCAWVWVCSGVTARQVKWRNNCIEMTTFRCKSYIHSVLVIESISFKRVHKVSALLFGGNLTGSRSNRAACGFFFADDVIDQT
jgi:hypothetical protein